VIEPLAATGRPNGHGLDLAAPPDPRRGTVAGLMAHHGAQLWINHDRAQRDRLRLAPEFYE
jgi:hypothetical protein